MRKYKLPDELTELTLEQLAEVNYWLSKYTYKKVGQLIFEKHAKTINDNKLCRYYQRLRDVEELNRGSDQPITVPDLIALKNGDPLSTAEVNQQLLQARCFRAAQRPDLNASDLLQLFQICTYNDRRDFAGRRLEIDRHLAELRQRNLDLKQRVNASAPDSAGTNQPGHLT